MAQATSKFKTEYTIEEQKARYEEFIATFYDVNEEIEGSLQAWAKLWVARGKKSMKFLQYGSASDLLAFLESRQLINSDKSLYITKNLLKHGKDRKNDRVLSFLNMPIDIDFENMPQEVREKKKAALYEILLEDTLKDPSIPSPNAFIDSGRGVHLWYGLEQASYKCAKSYDIACRKLIEYYKDLIESYAILEGLKVDESCTMSHNGIIRMPISYNDKSCTWANITYLGGEKLDFVSYANDICVADRKAYAKANGEKAEQSARKCKRNAVPGGSKRKLIAYTSGGMRLRAEYIHGLAKKVIERNNYSNINKGYRDNLLVCVYSVWAEVEGTEVAFEKVTELNNLCMNPLQDRELRKYISTAKKRANNNDGYKFSNEGVAEYLNISIEEYNANKPIIKAKRVTKRQIEASIKRAEKCQNREERTEAILEYYSQGYKQATIAEAVGCSLGTVNRTLKAHGISKKADNATIIESGINEGLSNKEIAARANCAISTVMRHKVGSNAPEMAEKQVNIAEIKTYIIKFIELLIGAVCPKIQFLHFSKVCTSFSLLINNRGLAVRVWRLDIAYDILDLPPPGAVGTWELDNFIVHGGY